MYRITRTHIEINHRLSYDPNKNQYILIPVIKQLFHIDFFIRILKIQHYNSIMLKMSDINITRKELNKTR